MGRNRDDCMTSFDVVQHYDNFRLYQCKYCSKNIKSSSSTRLKSHLKRCKGYRDVGENIDAPFKKLLTDMFISYDLPKSLLRDKNFVRLFTIAPNMMKSISRIFSEVSDIVSNDIPSSYSSKMKEVVRFLNKRTFLVLSIDTLEDSLGRNTFYLTVISDKRFYHLLMEDYTGTELTEEAVFAKCEELFEKISHTKFICVVAENQTIFNSVKKKIVQKYPNISNVTCSATLFHQVSYKVVTQNTDLCECIDKCSKIEQIIKNNKEICQYIRRLSRDEIPFTDESRWCTIYDFLIFLIEKRAIIESSMDGDQETGLFDEDFLYRCNEVVNLLHPFSIALKISENIFSNLSNVYIPFRTIKNHLVDKKVSKILIQDFTSKMNVGMLEFCYLINPLHSFHDIPNMDMKMAESFLMTHLDEDHDRIVQDFRFFVGKYDKFEQALQNVSDPIMWWKLNRYNAPELCDLAIRYLSIPASSVLVKNNLKNIVDKIIANNKSRANEDIDKIAFIMQEFEIL